MRKETRLVDEVKGISQRAKMLLLVFCLALVPALGQATLVGSIETIPEKDYRNYAIILNFAATTINDNRETSYDERCTRFLEVNKQVIRGELFKVKIEFFPEECRINTDDTCELVRACNEVHKCSASVWSRPWHAEPMSLEDLQCNVA
ncbi:cystatin-C-like [Anneissia japonica]|uniref:cystatin-C-like n=1 Tax=Anneissia japonica TaxID=1529436 RepID=UPI0014258ACF|nr:cystatin-C-like [Anneissia japonica]